MEISIGLVDMFAFHLVGMVSTISPKNNPQIVSPSISAEHVGCTNTCIASHPHLQGALSFGELA